MYRISYPIESMGLVYLPTNLPNKNHPFMDRQKKKRTHPMDPMAMNNGGDFPASYVTIRGYLDGCRGPFWGQVPW